MIEVENVEKSILDVDVNSVFKTLNNINVNQHTEKKGGLTYLSWAWSWAKVKENYPNAFYTIYENETGWNYFTDGKTCWVKTGVTINGLEHIEYLPVMDFKNKSIPFDNITSTDVNKTIQRSLTKACARHGLGLYIYAGEDLPEVEQTTQTDMQEKISEKDLEILRKTLLPNQTEWVIQNCGVETLADLTNQQYGEVMRALASKSNGNKG